MGDRLHSISESELALRVRIPVNLEEEELLSKRSKKVVLSLIVRKKLCLVEVQQISSLLVSVKERLLEGSNLGKRNDSRHEDHSDPLQLALMTCQVSVSSYLVPFLLLV